jgi:hypothetical protein
MMRMTDPLAPVVPAYFHPAVAGEEWRTLSGVADSVRLVVANVASGSGEVADAAYVEAIDRLRRNGVPVAGYVDTDYGHRDRPDALADVSRYRDWYGVSSVFFDRVSSGIEHIPHYRALAANSRRLGMELVAFNHGTHPVRDYAEYADLLGTFEGSFPAYLQTDVPSWVHDYPAQRFFHLLYDTPAMLADTVATLALERNVGSVYRTERSGPNPWDMLPASFPTHLATG